MKIPPTTVLPICQAETGDCRSCTPSAASILERWLIGSILSEWTCCSTSRTVVLPPPRPRGIAGDLRSLGRCRRHIASERGHGAVTLRKVVAYSLGYRL